MVALPRIACLLIDHFPAVFDRARNPSLGKRPIIIADSGRNEVFDFSPDVAETGVAPGMPLQQAIALAKDAAILEANVPKYQVAFGGILDALELVSPLVEGETLGCGYLDLKGLDSLYKDYDHLLTEMLRAVPGSLPASVGLAQGKFPAVVAARLASPGQAMIVPEDVKGFLGELPVAFLPVPWEVISRLKDFGLDTLGDVAALPVGALQAQFGPIGRRMWELANGIDVRPVIPRKAEEVVVESLSFPSPMVSLEPIVYGAESLLRRAFSRPHLHNRYVRVATLEASVSRGTLWQRRISFKQPAGSVERAFFPIKSVLERTQFPGPLEDLTLSLSGLTGEAGLQTSLFWDVRRQDQLRETLKQLEASLGKRPPIYQVREVEVWSRMPERRRALIELNP